MKQTLLKILAVLLVINTGFSATTDSGNLTVSFSNISNDQGVIRAALFNTASSFQQANSDNAAGAVAKASAPIQNNQATIVFSNIPYGTYAIKSFHDANLSGVMPRNVFGVPQTDYGFSNNMNTHGAPTFNQASFVFDANNTSTQIVMKQ